jgi:ferritin-like metal-binding protein YciE
MDQLRDLLVDELQDLFNAENQLVEALPAMVSAAHRPKLKEAFQKHLDQTRGHVDRLRSAFEALGEKAESKNCNGMKGLIQEGKDRIGELKDQEELAADLGLIAAAQKVEHYEISGYGTARCLARQINELEVDRLLSQTLGEEERADYLLSEISNPILQEATLADNAGAEAPAKSRAQKA